MNFTHSDYTEWLPKWARQRDVKGGKDCIVSHDSKIKAGDAAMSFCNVAKYYIPPTAGMYAMAHTTGATGCSATDYAGARYMLYLLRIESPAQGLSRFVDTMYGKIFARSSTPDLPAQLEYQNEKATTDGRNFDQLIRKTVNDQLTTGRYIWLMTTEIVDAEGNVDKEAESGKGRVTFAAYEAENCVDWLVIDNEVQYVLFKEKCTKNNEDEYLVAALDASGTYYQYKTDCGKEFEQFDYLNPPIDENLFYPSYTNRTLDYVPVTFFNSSNNLPDVETPLSGDIAELCLSYMQTSADYYKCLGESGSGTLVAINCGEIDNDFVPSGSDILLKIKGDGDKPASIEYVEASGNGTKDRRDAMDKTAIQIASTFTLIESGTESGIALQEKSKNKTASVVKLVDAAVAGATKAILQAAEWMQATDTDKLNLQLNSNFGQAFSAADAIALFAVYTQGGLSKETMYNVFIATGVPMQASFADYDADTELFDNAASAAALSLVAQVQAEGAVENDE